MILENKELLIEAIGSVGLVGRFLGASSSRVIARHRRVGFRKEADFSDHMSAY